MRSRQENKRVPMRIKRMISIICIFLVLITGCGNSVTTSTIGEDDGVLRIVTTIFPIYDWTSTIMGEHGVEAEITMLINNGVDLHSFEPTTDDMIAIAECDLFIHVGGTSDSWADDALKNTTNKNRKVINLVEILGDSVKMEEVVEGMEESDHDHDHDHGFWSTIVGVFHSHDHEHEDEHVWLSLRNAEVVCNTITEALIELDESGTSVYTDNGNTYVEKLRTLDEAYEKVVEEAECTTLLFGDRFPFRYLVDDYNLDYYAAFSGCSAETEASFETIAFLAEKVDELELSSVMTIDGSDQKIAQTVMANTISKELAVYTLDSMQSITAKEVEEGATYLSIMESNLEVLKAVL
ncbi:MAG: metal ABC transporter substrate-binding protein [Eubacteriales bacterium]